MTVPEAIDTTAVEVGELEPATRDLAIRPGLAVAPAAGAAELVERLDVIRAAMQTAMQDGIDYGRIPGVDKPTLLKPGAEKLGVLFQLDIEFEDEKQWGPDDHLTVTTKATVFHAPTLTRLGAGTGICSTREKKYGKRKQGRACPSCGVEAVIKGKAEYGGGWLCFKKKDGCGAKFPDGDPAIEAQEVGEVENPDMPDTWNTVLKMARKRARVDAVLAVTGASALFTQDAEDRPSEPAPTPEPLEASPELKGLVRNVLGYLLDGNEASVRQALEGLSTQFEARTPAAAAQAIVLVGSAVKRYRENGPPAGSSDLDEARAEA